MSYTAFPAAQVYQACHKALEHRQGENLHIGEYEADRQRLGRLADLSFDAARLNGDDATVFVSTDDHPLIHGHWGRPLPALKDAGRK